MVDGRRWVHDGRARLGVWSSNPASNCRRSKGLCSSPWGEAPRLDLDTGGVETTRDGDGSARRLPKDEEDGLVREDNGEGEFGVSLGCTSCE